MIFWDLDGPILDVRDKYFNVYKDILLSNNCKYLSVEEYWELKRSKVNNKNILLKTNCKISLEIFQINWLKKIETDEYMKYDKLQPGIIEVLSKAIKSNKMIIVTLRHSEEMLLKQLKTFGLRKYFIDVLSSGDDVKPRWKMKYNLVTYFLKNEKRENHVMIGDTETDILAGNKLGFYTIAVLCGIRNRELLLANPKIHYNNSSDLISEF